MKQILLGIIALGMLLTWAVLYFGGGDDSTAMAASVCLRAGLVLGALSLALPQVMVILARVPLWMMGCMGIGLLAIVRWPKSAVYVIPGMAALWMLRPRTANRAAGSSRRIALRGKTAPGKTRRAAPVSGTSQSGKVQGSSKMKEVSKRGIKAGGRATGQPGTGKPGVNRDGPSNSRGQA
jgi:hypothetical protein